MAKGDQLADARRLFNRSLRLLSVRPDDDAEERVEVLQLLANSITRPRSMLPAAADERELVSTILV